MRSRRLLEVLQFLLSWFTKFIVTRDLNIADTSPNLDPSLQERQRQLKRARLQDSLTERLSNRPGPLELVEGNILQIHPELQHAIKGGVTHCQALSLLIYGYNQ